jgi:hypothetical protein
MEHKPVKISFCLFLLLILISANSICAMGKKEKENGLQKVEVSGRVRLVGNSPMTFLVLSGEGREWHIEPEEQVKLIDLQQQIVRVKAQEYYRDLVFANGSSAGRQYYLKNITVIDKRLAAFL